MEICKWQQQDSNHNHLVCKWTLNYLAKWFILHRCTKNHNPMRYGSWDTEWETIFCHFGPFHALSPPSNQENQHFEKHLEMSSLYTRTKNHGHLMFSEIWSATAIINCHFAPFFPFTPRLILKVKIWKKCKEKPGYIILLHICTINYDHMMYGSWDMVRDGWRKRRTDTTNGRIEKVTKLIKFRL